MDGAITLKHPLWQNVTVFECLQCGDSSDYESKEEEKEEKVGKQWSEAKAAYFLENIFQSQRLWNNLQKHKQLWERARKAVCFCARGHTHSTIAN